MRKFDGYVAVKIDACGYSGGIWVLCKCNMNVRIDITNDQLVHLEVRDDNMDPWWCTIVYSKPYNNLKSRMRTELKAIVDQVRECGW